MYTCNVYTCNMFKSNMIQNTKTKWNEYLPAIAICKRTLAKHIYHGAHICSFFLLSFCDKSVYVLTFTTNTIDYMFYGGRLGLYQICKQYRTTCPNERAMVTKHFILLGMSSSRMWSLCARKKGLKHHQIIIKMVFDTFINWKQRKHIYYRLLDYIS